MKLDTDWQDQVKVNRTKCEQTDHHAEGSATHEKTMPSNKIRQQISSLSLSLLAYQVSAHNDQECICTSMSNIQIGKFSLNEMQNLGVHVTLLYYVQNSLLCGWNHALWPVSKNNGVNGFSNYGCEVIWKLLLFPPVLAVTCSLRAKRCSSSSHCTPNANSLRFPKPWPLNINIIHELSPA